MKRVISLVLFLVCITIAVSAQEFRGTLTGQVADPTGAVIPSATLTITNESTGAVTRTVSGGNGFYTVPFLTPGKYSIGVNVSGFKPYLHTGIEVLTAQTITENIKLDIGTTADTVTVTSGSPLIDSATASTGQVLTEEEINDLPSNGRTPLAFARDAYGAVPKMKHATAAATPFQNSTADDFSLGGGLSSSNELLLNGVPNMQDSSRTAGFSPFMDAVNTIRVDEFNANASTGDTSGGTVDITTKSGTNQFHGSLVEFYQDTEIGGAKPFLYPSVTIVPSHYSQFGASIGGPIWIPKVFNGRNKLFFFYAFEGYTGSTPPTSVVNDVPTCAERGQNAPAAGSRFCTDNPVGTPDFPDFSQTLAANNPANQLYDPYSTTGSGSNAFQRAAIPEINSPMRSTLPEELESPSTPSQGTCWLWYQPPTQQDSLMARTTTLSSRPIQSTTNPIWDGSITTSARQTRSSAKLIAANISPQQVTSTIPLAAVQSRTSPSSASS